MIFVVGIPVAIVRKCYKAYKKHEAEKEAREKGIPHTVIDPSYEFQSSRNSAWSNPHSSSDRGLRHRNSSSSSISSDCSAAAEAEAAEKALENDEEFRQFIQQQKQAYMSQHGMLKECSSTSRSQSLQSRSVSGAVELPVPSTEPPAYELVISGDDTNTTRSDSRSNPRSQVSRAMRESEEVYVVSPTAASQDTSPSEIDSTEISPTTPRSPVGHVAELPGSFHNAVELPARS